MSVIEFHIWAEGNPVGEANKLAVITDEDVVVGESGPAIWYEPALHGLGGRAGFSINRHSSLATSTIIREDNFVRVKVPEIQAGYLPFAWWMRTGEFHLIDSDEQGGENITIEGPGLLHKLATGSLYHSSTVDDQPARGSADRDGLWWWIDEPYGAMLTRIMEEGRHSPYPDPPEAGSPLEFFDITFSRTSDSDSVAWPNIDNEFQVDIGIDLMSVADKLRESGNLYVIGDASDVNALTVHCYQSYGSDKTGAFGSGTVRFEKAVNIATELVRKSESGARINRLLLRDSDGNYSTEELPGSSAAVEHWGFWDAGQTNDDTLLNAIGLNVLRASQTAVEPVGFEAVPGKTPTEGRYLPTLHYDVGDTVTVHTGTDPEDYEEADQLVVAYRVSIREAATDATGSTAQRSLKIEPQLNYYAPRYGASNIGEQAAHAPGCRCLQLCRAITDAEEPFVDRRYTSLTGTLTGDLTGAAGWDTVNAGEEYSLTATPTTTRDGGLSTTARDDVMFGQFVMVLDADTAAAIAAGGSTYLGSARTRTRAGIGISESAQDVISQDTILITVGDSTTVRGTAKAMHSLASSAGSTKWSQSSTYTEARFPALADTDVLTAVPGTVAGDRLVWEVGCRNFTPAPTVTGAHMWFNDSAAAAGDLPGIFSGTSTNLRSWFQLSAAGSPGTGDGHADLIGTSSRASRCDHRHDVHRDRAPTALDDGSLGYKVGTLWAQLDDLGTPTAIAGVWMLLDTTTGAAIWIPITSSSGPSGATILDELDDVVIGTPTIDDDLRFDGEDWTNDARKWEAVTDGEDVFVWEGDDLVHEWNESY